LSRVPEAIPNLWQVELTVPTPVVAAIEAALEPYAFSVSSFEHEGSEKIPLATRLWQVKALATEEPPLSEIVMALTEVAGRAGILVPDISVEPVPQLDWLAENRRYFPPQRLGRFFVVDPTERIATPAGAWAIRLAAGPAFGSGTHPTTQGCLAAIERIRNRRGRKGFRRVLDLGTGSGILAIAAARAGAQTIAAADIDPWSVRTAAENARRNGVIAHMQLLLGTVPSSRLAARGPYELLLANILAAPLRKMMPHLAKLLAPRGRLVLSGLLFDQEPGVRAAARGHGLILEGRIRNGEWPTLIMRRN
jgi:ribosomal protein L11 methyltransferase